MIQRETLNARRQSVRRHREPVRLPPTQRQLSRAVIRLMEELGAGRASDAELEAAQDAVYAFAEKSVSTAWSAVDAAIAIVRCYQGRRKVSLVYEDVVGPFRAYLEKGKELDLARKSEIIEAVKTAEGDEKSALEVELKELTLRGIPEGRSMELGEMAKAFLVEVIVPRFRPVSDSPLEVEDMPRMISKNLQFFDWLAVNVLFTESELATYNAAKEQDKAARATESGSPAPEAPVEEEVAQAS